jgi:hypothetical protein
VALHVSAFFLASTSLYKSCERISAIIPVLFGDSALQTLAASSMLFPTVEFVA